jgi:hypothetical protein
LGADFVKATIYYVFNRMPGKLDFRSPH